MRVPPGDTVVFLGGIHRSVKQAEVRRWCEQQCGGSVRRVRFVFGRRTRHHRGYGFVQFASPRMAERFVNDAESKQFALRGQIVSVSFCRAATMMDDDAPPELLLCEEEHTADGDEDEDGHPHDAGEPARGTMPAFAARKGSSSSGSSAGTPGGSAGRLSAARSDSPSSADEEACASSCGTASAHALADGSTGCNLSRPTSSQGLSSAATTPGAPPSIVTEEAVDPIPKFWIPPPALPQQQQQHAYASPHSLFTAACHAAQLDAPPTPLAPALVCPSQPQQGAVPATPLHMMTHGIVVPACSTTAPAPAAAPAPPCALSALPAAQQPLAVTAVPAGVPVQAQLTAVAPVLGPQMAIAVLPGTVSVAVPHVHVAVPTMQVLPAPHSHQNLQQLQPVLCSSLLLPTSQRS